MLNYPQDYLEKETKSENQLQILHGPFSPLHIESVHSEGAERVTLCSDNDLVVFIPQTTEIYRDQISSRLKDEITTLSLENRAKIISVIDSMMHIHGDQLYGEYLPQTYSSDTNMLLGSDVENFDGKSVNPVLFISNFLLKEAKEKEYRKEIVLHPDIIFFLSKGKDQNVENTLKFLNSMASILDIQLYFENIHLTNSKMQKAFAMFIDPMQLANMVRDHSSLGITIDIQHMESHFAPESIENIIVSSMNTLQNSTKIIIHSREGFDEKYQSLYQKCIRNGIPWVVEP